MARQPSMLTVAVAGLIVVLGACGSPTPTRPPTNEPASLGPTSSATSSPAQTSSPAPISATDDTDPGPPAAAVTVPGLYLHPDLSVTGDETVSILRGAIACADLADLIEAGEWAVVDRQEASSAQIAGGKPFQTIMTLVRGDETALAWLAGGEACTARVARTTSGAITATGAAAIEGRQPHDEPYCVVTDTAVMLGAIYRPSGGPAVFIQLTAPVRSGSIELVPDDVEISIERRSLDLAGLAAILITGFQETDGGRFSERYEATTAGAAATLDVTSIQPYLGTLRLTGFEGPRGRLDIQAEISCHVPGAALDRTAKAAAVAAAATPTPTTARPTLGSIATAAPAMIVASGDSAIAGTYAVPETNLTCFRDPDSGAWTVSTLSSGAAGHSLFVSIVAAEAGGESKKIALGLIVGDGTGGRTALIDTLATPVNGVASGTVIVASGRITIRVEGRTADGVAVAANMACRL